MSQIARRSEGRLGVLLVDDHPTVCEALAYAVEDQLDLYVAGQCSSVSEALRFVESKKPDVAVVDLMLADGHGLDLIRDLQSRRPGLAVVVFSMFDEAVYAERALRAGASGYVMKSEPTCRVVEAIRSALRGDVFLSRRMTSRLLGGLRPQQRSAESSLDSLTDRELVVFQMLGQGYVVSEITERLNLSRKTVETYRRRAAEKLGFDSTSELLHFAIRWTNGQA